MKMRRAAVLGGLAGAAYLVLVRPRILTWGATRREAREAMPDEDIVAFARVRSTRAITIAATPDQVWPWLNQIGQDRGGLYSSTKLENVAGLRFRNAEIVRPEWQLKAGDLVRLVPPEKGDFGLTVLRSEAPRLLILGAGSDRPSPGLPVPLWIFSLREAGEGRTRLVVRWRSDYEPSILGHLTNKWAMEPIHFVMERSMLRGLKRRAER